MVGTFRGDVRYGSSSPEASVLSDTRPIIQVTGGVWLWGTAYVAEETLPGTAEGSKIN